MASLPRRRLTAMVGPPPPTKFSPFKELGTSGVAVFGGHPVTHEKNVLVSGQRRWITYADMVANTSIVAAGVRYFLNIISHAKWSVAPAEKQKGTPAPGAQEAADLVDSVINSMTTPWRRIARRAAMYRFHGFGVQEWTAKRRDQDGKIGIEDIEARPQHTIDRWEVDDRGVVLGVWQMKPQTSETVFLPRGKVLYLVEDSLTDSPDGLGLFRHLIDPYIRLQKYMTLEGWGFERDLRGIPIGRIPYRAIQQWVASGTMTQEEANTMIRGIENFVKMQTKTESTSIVLDSAPYVVENEGGKSVSSVMQFGLELLQGQSPDFAAMASAISRINQEMARVIGVEHLLLGGEGGANRALSEDKSRNFYLTVNGTLDEIVDGCNKDIVAIICDLNGIKEELRPKINHSDVSFRAIAEVTAALRDMATAGAVLAPDDPAINDVRDLLGISQAPPPTPEMMGAFLGTDEDDEEGGGKTPPKPGDKKEEDDDEDEDDVEVEKFNPNHDEMGRFSSGDGGTSISRDDPNVTGGGSGMDITRDMSFKSSEPRQNASSLGELYSQAKAAEADFQKMLTDVAVKTGGEMQLPPVKDSEPGTRLKRLSSAERKLRDELGNDHSKLVDVLRATLLYDTVGDSRHGLAVFLSEHRRDVVRVKDRHENPTSGYRDLLVSYRTSTGHIAEVQFNSRNMLAAKQGEGHSLYERARLLVAKYTSGGLNFRGLSIIQNLKSRSLRIYDKAFRNDGNHNYKRGRR